MRLLYLILLLTGFALAGCEPVVATNDSQPKKEELHKETYPSGVLKAKGRKNKEGQKVGQWKYFTPNGTPLTTVTWDHQTFEHKGIDYAFMVPADYGMNPNPSNFVAFQLVKNGATGFAPNIVVMSPKDEKTDQKELWQAEMRAMTSMTDTLRTIRRMHKNYRGVRGTQMELWSRRGEVTNRSGVYLWDDPCAQVQINFYSDESDYEVLKMIVDEFRDSFKVVCGTK